MPQIGSSSGVTRSSGNRVSRANGSIPNHRHRARTLPTEQSIGSPCCTSLLRGSWTSLCGGRLNLFTTQHDRSGEDGCLITLDHFEPLDLYGVRGQPAAQPPLIFVRPVQFGSAEPFFPSLCCIYWGDEKSQRRALLRPHGKEWI
jgi:hypothetical protein